MYVYIAWCSLSVSVATVYQKQMTSTLSPLLHLILDPMKQVIIIIILTSQMKEVRFIVEN